MRYRQSSLCGLLIVWPLMVVLAILVKVRMPGGPAFFCQKRVGKDGKLEDEMMAVGYSGISRIFAELNI